MAEDRSKDHDYAIQIRRSNGEIIEIGTPLTLDPLMPIGKAVDRAIECYQEKLARYKGVNQWPVFRS